MSEKEVRRAGVMARVKAGELKLRAASEMLRISYRQAKRLWKRYREGGSKGLVHRSVGRRSNRAKPEKFRNKALRLVREKYSGDEDRRFGPTLAAEHLAEDDGLEVNAETLRLWMLEEGLWSRRRKRKEHRKRRERKKHFGELVQLDGSFHEWFEEPGVRPCLLNMVDDATGVTLSQFHEQETTWAAVDLSRVWIAQYGVPRRLYTDWKTVYLREPTEKERDSGEVPLTQFGRMCAKLGIEIIGASSPQAKGRVERNNGVHQDRLVKKMRVKQIRTAEKANRYLREQYLPEHNRRFAQQPAEPEDYHLKAPSQRRLDEIFRLEEERVISNDWVVRYNGRLLQIGRQSRHAPARGKVIVAEARDGSLSIYYRGRAVEWNQIPSLPTKKVTSQTAPAGRAIEVHKKLYIPAADHPWRQAYLPERRAAAV
jgi:transposase